MPECFLLTEAKDSQGRWRPGNIEYAEERANLELAEAAESRVTSPACIDRERERFLPFRSPYGHLVFHVPHCEEGPQLRKLVLKGGGELTDVAGSDSVLHLIPAGWDTTCTQTKWALSANFVPHCVAAQKLLDIQQYLVNKRHNKPGDQLASSVNRGAGSSSRPSCDILVEQAQAPAQRGGCATEGDEQDERSAGAQDPAATAGPGGRRRVGRLRFTAEEDKALMQWVSQHPCAPAQGRQLWEGAERAGLTRHSWQSMQNRWRRHIQKRRRAISGIEGEVADEAATTSGGVVRQREHRCIAASAATRPCRITTRDSPAANAFAVDVDDKVDQFEDSLEEDARDCGLAMVDGEKDTGESWAPIDAHANQDAIRSLSRAPQWLSNLQDASMHINLEGI